MVWRFNHPCLSPFGMSICCLYQAAMAWYTRYAPAGATQGHRWAFLGLILKYVKFLFLPSTLLKIAFRMANSVCFAFPKGFPPSLTRSTSIAYSLVSVCLTASFLNTSLSTPILQFAIAVAD